VLVVADSPFGAPYLGQGDRSTIRRATPARRAAAAMRRTASSPNARSAITASKATAEFLAGRRVLVVADSPFGAPYLGQRMERAGAEVAVSRRPGPARRRAAAARR
jgi:hypothetical protein